MRDKVLSLLGIARRADKMVFGEAILEQFKDKNIKYVFIASDASVKTKERYLKKCRYYQVPFSLNYDAGQLDKAIGRANIKTIGITDEGFAKKFILEGGVNNGETD